MALHGDMTQMTQRVNKHTRAPRAGRLIWCPNCSYERRVFHFSWSAAQCAECETMVDKYDWYVEPPPNAQDAKPIDDDDSANLDDMLTGGLGLKAVSAALRDDQVADLTQRSIRAMAGVYATRASELTDNVAAGYIATAMFLLEGAAHMLRGMVPDERLETLVSGLAAGVTASVVDDDDADCNCGCQRPSDDMLN